MSGLALLLLAARAGAQATTLVDPSDPSYEDLDRLVTAGLVARFATGQRPMSRAEFIRLVRDADTNLARAERQLRDSTPSACDLPCRGRLEELRDLAASLRERLGIERQSDTLRHQHTVAPVRAMRLEGTWTDSPLRRIPPNNGIGEIDGYLNPLLANRQGRPLSDGYNLLLESTHDFESRYVAISVTPQLLARSRPAGAQMEARLQELQFRLLASNLALDVGREYQEWGQGPRGGLLGSNNAPPLDLIKLSSEHPFSLPWLLRHMGPAKLSLFYADLGGQQNFPHPYFIGYKASFLPSPAVEIGGSVYTKSGGHGAPRASASARVIDAFPFLDAAFFGNFIGTRGKFQFSDRYAGFDGRVHVRRAADAQLYWEVLLNDFDVHRLRSVFWEDAGHLLGLALPRLTPNGRLSVSVELHHTGIRYYEHHQFTSGQTLREVLIGDPLGPDAGGGYVDVGWCASARQRFTLEGAVERRSNDQYESFSSGATFGFRRIQLRPKEWRGRLLASWRKVPERGGLGLHVEAGYERARNFNFSEGVNRDGVLARVALEYRFR